MQDILKQNIIKELGLDELSQEKQEEILLEVGSVIFQGVLIRVMELLSVEDQTAFGKLVEEKPDDREGLLNFLQEKVPNMNDIVKEEVAKFKQESVDLMGKTE